MTSGLPLSSTTAVNGECSDTSGGHSRYQKNADDGWVIPKKTTNGAKERTREEKPDDLRVSCGRVRDVLHRVGVDTGRRSIHCRCRRSRFSKVAVGQLDCRARYVERRHRCLRHCASYRNRVRLKSSGSPRADCV